jgi:hypothetical protein
MGFPLFLLSLAARVIYLLTSIKISPRNLIVFCNDLYKPLAFTRLSATWSLPKKIELLASLSNLPFKARLPAWPSVLPAACLQVLPLPSGKVLKPSWTW